MTTSHERRTPGGAPAPRQAAWRRLLGLPARSAERIADDVDAELAFHLAMREEELRAMGLSSNDAAREARRRFGNIEEARVALRASERVADRARARRTWLTDLRHDVAYAARRCLREPGFSLVVILTLTLGIGSTVTIASVVQRLVVAPLPYPGAERLIVIDQRTTDGSLRVSPTPALIEAFRGATPSLERIETLASSRLPTTRDGAPAMITTGFVSPGLLDFLAVAPMIGRRFAAGDTAAGAPPVAMLAWSTWQRRYGESADVLGSTVTVNGVSHTIVGVMPRLFDPSVFALLPRSELWLPHAPARGDSYLAALGVLRPSARLDVARRELTAARARLPEGSRFETLVPSAEPLMERAGSETRASLVITSVATLLVLLIGCMNVANLLLARGAARDRELAIRTAIGASRGRLVRQLLTESALLALAGGACGIALSRALLALVAAWRPSTFAALDDVQLDPRLLAFALVLSVLTAFLFGLAPALLNSRGHGGTLQAGGRTVGAGRAGQRTRHLLAFAEVACSVALVVGATLLVRSARELQQMRLGYDVNPLVTLRVQRASPRATDAPNATAPTVAALLAPALDRLRALPGVESFTVGDGSPGTFGGCMCEFLPDGASLAPTPQLRFMIMWQADSAYLRTAGTRLLAGRGLSNDTTAHEALVTQSTAAHLMPGRSAVGRRFRLSREGPLLTVVGVIEDQRSPEGWMPSEGDQIVTQGGANGDEPAITVRVTGSAPEAVRTITRIIEETSPSLHVVESIPLRQTVDEARAPQRFLRLLLIGFAACALLLAAIGLYGVMAFGVAQRRREIGVRMALGAGRGAIVGLVLREGLGITLAGLVAGCVGAVGLARLLKGLLLGVTAADPVSYLMATLVVLAATGVALWIPTRRALSVDVVQVVGSD